MKKTRARSTFRETLTEIDRKKSVNVIVKMKKKKKTRQQFFVVFLRLVAPLEF